jgi:tRNA dimethylallyltransferase
MIQKTLISVVGPTAIGKTALSIGLANAYDTEIISADSRQFYKEMSIGTAVPSKEELAAAKHHFIQHISIFQDYSVGDFEKEALVCLDELFQKKDVVVLVGGSGLYVDALTKGLDQFPEVPSAIKESLQKDFNEKGLTYLQNLLKEVDPVYHNKVDLENPMRVLRALEVSLTENKPYSSYIGNNKKERPFRTIYIGIDAPRAIVYKRIEDRVDIMIQEGLLEEAKALVEHKKLNALNTVGYKELFSYFDKECDLETAISEIKKNTRRFAKRQGTWFRKNQDIQWVSWDKALEQAQELLKKEI